MEFTEKETQVVSCEVSNAFLCCNICSDVRQAKVAAVMGDGGRKGDPVRDIVWKLVLGVVFNVVKGLGK